jgi:hypothetical protein
MYHNVPLNNDRWLYDPWAAIISQGWGFCGHAAASYVRIARAAGYEARVWGLTGHVVPEILVDGSWEMYDPDLAVYYLTTDGAVAGVDDLVVDPGLITMPHDPVLGPEDHPLPYSQMIAEFYGSPADNYIGDQVFEARFAAAYQPFILPAGATFTYPGRWTRTVIGVDGDTPYEVPYYLQAKMTLSSGWNGEVVLPWMLWEIRGEGRVRIFGVDYTIGSEELQAVIQKPTKQIATLEVLQGSANIELIFFINAMRYAFGDVNSVQITTQDAWAVQMEKTVVEPDAQVSANGVSEFAKPVEPR